MHTIELVKDARHWAKGRNGGFIPRKIHLHRFEETDEAGAVVVMEVQSRSTQGESPVALWLAPEAAIELGERLCRMAKGLPSPQRRQS